VTIRPSFLIDDRHVGADSPTYFIADIGANHDGDLGRATELIRLAADAGADAAKFQHFRASTIVSDVGFRRLGTQMSHQASWSKPVTEVYDDASLPTDWTAALKAECDNYGIAFLSSPYDAAAVDHLDPFVSAFKVGSGDIDWLENLEYIAAKRKPVILGTGAANLDEVRKAAHAITKHGTSLALLQCNTNYTGSDENFDHLNLRVIQTYAREFPGAVLGLSDHTRGLAAVLGAVALGAQIVERHFTDDPGRSGPDHGFAMTPAGWREMVDETRRLERAMGSPEKVVCDNETDTVVVQRRSVRAARPLDPGTTLTRGDLEVLRPAPKGSIRPSEIDEIIGGTVARRIDRGEELQPEDVITRSSRE